ncbi:IS30 family transposase [Candidatus Thiodiazotropha sp. LNASS1]|uniref:IS30 family transposase n=1 Tax=Candidatus Thiodiazotropha sp. LNASS1 TaxID=3096260 RepID=UPI00281439CA|nr:IS30 family transposase [Candidatus Thiodiazotropha taylori]
MAQRGRPGLSHDLKQEVWRRWRSGESLSDIARAVNSQPGSIFGILRLHGGISPAKRCRAENSLTLSEREEISRGLSAGKSMRAIATDLRRSPSTISREIARNGGAQRYRAIQADEKAWDRARRPKLCLLALNGRLRRTVTEKLALDWSPEQISGWLKKTFSDDENMYVSHETIYRSIYIQARGVLKKELQKHLRTQRIFRQSRYNNLRGIPRGKIVDAVSISERPPEIEDRAIPGHWEGDLIAGSANTHIATLVERKSRFAMLIKVTGKDTNTVVSAISRHIKRLPVELRQSVTWDRGSEMANHKDFTVATDAKVYFCDPSSPWQRGTNENTNRLLRQYFPKKTDLSVYTQRELSQVAKKLNQRPRKVLDFQTPADTLQQCVARTD